MFRRSIRISPRLSSLPKAAAALALWAAALAATFPAGRAAAGAAQPDPSRMIATMGLARSEAALAGAAPADADGRMALGAVRFLRAIEKTLQLRWKHDARLEIPGLPLLDLPFPPNPAPRPSDPALISRLFETLGEDMAATRAPLEAIGPQEDASLTLDLGDLWFDVNDNRRRDPGEALLEIAARSLSPQRQRLPESTIVRFDRADVDWLIAYTELLSGSAALVAAFDPTEAIARVRKSRGAMQDLLGDTAPGNGIGMLYGSWADQAAMLLGALQQQPDPDRTREARRHWLKMIAANRAFWAGIARETDDENEWIPNERQHAALGFELPAGTADAWLAVLEDARAVLEGERLVPFWRIDPAGGINIKRLMEDPPAGDLAGWIQGWSLVPYMERGPLIGDENLRRFQALVAGRALLMAFLLN